ncbi:MAG: thiamine pyrophosphate-binding protein [Candidatus Bathyarchaeota archaeon]|nr:thiamine pyrophosphate-binding protein [Candidatus Bathyarchaeota archaeon]
MSTDSLTVGQYLLNQLKTLTQRVYGIPGDFVINFFKLLEDDPEIELYTFSHEQGAGFAAVADAKATRKPAVAVVTYGPGVLNVINAVACAYAEKAPLILVAGGPPLSARRHDFFMHHTVKTCASMQNAMAQVTTQAVLLDDPLTAAEKIQTALRACQERMLPVYIELPADVVNQRISITKTPTSLQIDEARIKQATAAIVQRLVQAQNPVVMMGVESDRYNLTPQILTFTQRLNIPVICTMLSRDHLPTDEPNFYGIYLGVAGNKAANQLVAESDFVLVLGEMLSDVNLGAKLSASKRGCLCWCFSGEVNIGDQVFENVSLRALVDALGNAQITPKTTQLPAKIPLKVNRACKANAKTLIMSEVIDAINWLFGKYDPMQLVADTGDSLFASLDIETFSVLAPCFYGTMGFAVPAAIGYALSTKTRPIVLVGDGSFQMTGQEIIHCARFKINPIFVVINNRRWGMEQLFHPTAQFNELQDWHYAELAQLWGGKGYRCTNCKQLYNALEDAYTQKCFSLIEVVTERDELSDELMAWIDEQKEQV